MTPRNAPTFSVSYREISEYEDKCSIRKADHHRKTKEIRKKKSNYQSAESTLWRINTPESLSEMIEVGKAFADTGDGAAMGRIGRAYRDGRGVAQDLSIAADWMRKARTRKIGWADWELVDILFRMNTSESNSEAVSIAQPSAESGNRELQARMGRAYRDGKGVGKDLVKAAEWMRKAADQDLGWAKNELLTLS